MKQIISFTAALTIAFSTAVSAAEIQIDFDSTPLSTPGITEENTVLIPLRNAAAQTGAQITFDSSTSTATVSLCGEYAEFTADSDIIHLGVYQNYADVKSETDAVQVPSLCRIYDGTMYVPIESFNRALRLDVAYDGTKAIISTPAEAEGWIYYASWSDGGHLYKIDTNGRNRQLLSTEDCYATLYYDGYIFYMVRGENDKKIYRMNTDGTNVICITPDGEYVESDYYSIAIGFGEGRVFYNVVDTEATTHAHVYKGLYSVNIDGTDRKCIAEGNARFRGFHKGYVYYNLNTAGRYYACRVKPDGTDTQILTPDGFDYIYINLVDDDLWLETRNNQITKYYTFSLQDDGGYEITESKHGYHKKPYEMLANWGNEYDEVLTADNGDLTVFRKLSKYYTVDYSAIYIKKKGDDEMIRIPTQYRSNDIYYLDGNLYYVSNKHIYMIDTTNLSETELYSDDDIYTICGTEPGVLYYKNYDNTKLMRFDVNTRTAAEAVRTESNKDMYDSVYEYSSRIRKSFITNKLVFKELDGTDRIITNENTHYAVFVPDNGAETKVME